MLVSTCMYVCSCTDSHLHSPVNKHSNLVQICHLQADGCTAVQVSDSGADEGMINMENGLANASLCRALA